MAITHTDLDDNPIPFTFYITFMLLDHHIMHSYSRKNRFGWRSTLYESDRRNVTAIKPPIKSENILIQWTVGGVDVWSNRRCLPQKALLKLPEEKRGEHQVRTKPIPLKTTSDRSNTIPEEDTRTGRMLDE